MRYGGLVGDGMPGVGDLRGGLLCRGLVCG
jgi:hypothetical protein